MSHDFTNFLSGGMLSLVCLGPAVFLGDPSLKMELVERDPVQSISTFEYQKCA
jgi:hypothetical protein